MNMFKPTNEKTVEEYLAAVSEDRKEAVFFVHDFIQKTVPHLLPYFANNMIGYGSFPCKNYKKETIEWPLISLANQKNYISIYVASAYSGQYVAERHKDKLGKVKVGKSCISFKKLKDLNLNTLEIVLKEAEKHPGLNLGR